MARRDQIGDIRQPVTVSTSTTELSPATRREITAFPALLTGVYAAFAPAETWLDTYLQGHTDQEAEHRLAELIIEPDNCFA